MTSSLRRASDDPRPFALAGYGIIVFCFAVLGGWAALSPLASAVVANGHVVTQGNKKTVQHFEGGIIKEIYVLEGDHVLANQILIRLDETQPKANLEIARNQLYGTLARDARLSAELNGSEEVQFPQELTSVADDPIAAKAMEEQRAQFKERRGTLDAQISVLRSRG